MLFIFKTLVVNEFVLNNYASLINWIELPVQILNEVKNNITKILLNYLHVKYG